MVFKGYMPPALKKAAHDMYKAHEEKK